MTETSKDDLHNGYRKNVTRSHLVPLFILLLFSSMGHNLAAPADTTATAVQEVGFQSNPLPLAIRGLAYIWAFILVLFHAGSTLTQVSRQGAFLLFAAYVAASMLWSAFPIKVLINVAHLVGLYLVLIASGRYFLRHPNSFFSTISGALGIALLSSIFVSILLPSIGVSLLDGRWQGLAGNPNSLGLIAMVSLWSNTAGLYLPASRKIRKWHFVGLAISAVALIGARSVTAVLTTALAVGLSIFLIRLESQSHAVRFMKIVAATWGLLIMAAALLAFMPQIFEAKGFFGLLGRSTTFSGRTHLWEEAVRLIELRPWLGWSFDSNLSVLKYLGGVGQFHSGYLDLMVRGGWIGMILFVTILAGVLRRILRLAKVEYHRAMIFSGMLCAILLHNVTEASIARETHLLWTLILFFYFFSFDREQYLHSMQFDLADCPPTISSNDVLPSSGRVSVSFSEICR